MAVTASAPAKVILFGEHFVVYGEPAIVIAIDRRAHVKVEDREDECIYVHSVDLGVSGFFIKKRFRAENGDPEARSKLEPLRSMIQRVLDNSNSKRGVNVEICSSIPIAAGLGSSSAVIAATVAALNRLLDAGMSKEEIFQVVYEAEGIVHGTPSGIDPAISTYGGALLYYKDKGFTPLDVKKDMPLIVGDTGIPHSTKELVEKVSERRRRYPSIIDPIIEVGGKLTLEAIEAVKKGDLSTLGDLMNINHALLSAIGVSNEVLERLIYASRNSEALGAKLTGAGGGGCMIALSTPNKLEKIANAIERAGGTAFIVKKTDEGVKIEN